MRVLTLYLCAAFLCAASFVSITLSAGQTDEQSNAVSAMAPEAVPIPEEEVASHETGNHGAVRLRLAGPMQVFQSVRLTIIVDTTGNVISATPIEGPRQAFEAAAAEAINWKYLQFEKEGAPVKATFTDYVRILPPEKLPKKHEPFPTVNSTDRVVMTLSRSGCYGTCPSYSVEIHGDGTVLYKGNTFVVVTGEHRDHLSGDQVSEILDAFRKADYFSLEDNYSYAVTDCPTYETSFRVDNVFKSVKDYVGDEAGMPESVTKLEEAIDRVADTQKWIKGNAGTVPALKREGWDFKSGEAAKVLARATQEKNSALVREFLGEGVGVSGSNESGNSALAAAALAEDHATVKLLMKAGAAKDDQEMKNKALGAAARTGDIELVRMLLDYGADPKGVLREENATSTVLMQAASSGVSEVVEAILGGHPDVNARDEKGRTALWYLCDASTYYDEKRHVNRAQVVHLLARAHANLNVQDDEGNAPLHEAYESDIAKALIEDGANVDIRNADGETPLMRNFSVAVSRLLNAAGADIHARDHNGKTALDHAADLEPNGDRVHFLGSLSSDKVNK
jgi:ankyrin repeat protein